VNPAKGVIAYMKGYLDEVKITIENKSCAGAGIVISISLLHIKKDLIRAGPRRKGLSVPLYAK
jgi:hypothetical protein